MRASLQAARLRARGAAGAERWDAASPSPEATKYSRALDRRIIEGYLHDPRAMFEALGRAGVAAEQIMRRGVTLGVTPALLDLQEPECSALAARECLCCERPFLSVGIHNRLCRRCRGRR